MEVMQRCFRKSHTLLSLSFELDSFTDAWRKLFKKWSISITLPVTADQNHEHDPLLAGEASCTSPDWGFVNLWKFDDLSTVREKEWAGEGIILLLMPLILPMMIGLKVHILIKKSFFCLP